MPIFSPTFIAAVGSAAGAAGVTLSAIKYVDKRREKSFRVNVTLKHGWPTYSNGTVGADVLLVEAMNPGSRPVTLTSYGILLPNKNTLVFHGNFGDGNALPHELAAGKNCLKWMDTSEVTKALLRSGWQGKIKLVGFYGDALGKKYRSKPLHFDIALWQRIAADQSKKVG